VAWLFIGFEPLVAPFLYLEFGWAMTEVFKSEVGWDYTGQWWIWFLLMAVFVLALTYRDIRLSTTAGVIFGAFEIAIFGALAIWMLISNAGDLNAQPFNPNHAVGDWSGVFKGMVFAILAFIGFEAAAPLGEEARHPRRTVPRAVVGSAIVIGAFYVLCAYAWVFGAGFDNFVTQATGADPWRDLGKVFWSTGWILVFLAICNSIAANSNAAVNAATRVFYALARNGLAPRPLARTHPEFKTPNGSRFNALLRVILPIGGIVLFFFPLYYQFYKVPPTYPVKYANWVAIAWMVLGVLVTLWIVLARPQRLEDMERVYVEDETVAPESQPAFLPEA
jgi:amino acid transporter